MDGILYGKDAGRYEGEQNSVYMYITEKKKTIVKSFLWNQVEKSVVLMLKKFRRIFFGHAVFLDIKI